MRAPILIAALMLWAMPGLQNPSPPAAPLRLVQTIPLPGVEGRIDHLAADVKGQRLFVAALGNNTLEVVDLRAGKRVHSITGLHEPQGVAYVPESNRIVVANGQGGGAEFYDGATYRRIAEVPNLEDADNVRYDPAAKRVYVGYGGGAIAILDAATGKRVGGIKLEGHPESFQLEKAGPRIFVNVPTAGHIAVLDRQKRVVIAKWPVTGAKSNFPMALDETNHRLFIGCRNPARILDYDTRSGKEGVAAPTIGDMDDLFYDLTHKWLYMSGGAGSLGVLEERPGFAEFRSVKTAPGARTSLFVPELKRLYLAVPHRGNQQAEIRVYEVKP